MSLTKGQLALRRQGITATDIPAIVGLDPYGRTAHDVWSDKVLERPDDEPDEWLELGDAIEPIVIRRLAKARGFRRIMTSKTKHTVISRAADTHIASVDAFFVAEDRYRDLPDGFTIFDAETIGEVKVVSPFHAEGWGKSETEIPDWCAVQVTWGLHVMGLPLAHVGALIWPKMRTYRVELDTELEGTLVEEADRFWRDYVVTKKAPAVDGSAGSRRMLDRLFPHATGPRFKASGQVEELAGDYFRTKDTVKVATAAHERVEQLLTLACGEADGIDGDGWRLNFRERKAYDVGPKAGYHVDATRVFDMRKANGGRGR